MSEEWVLRTVHFPAPRIVAPDDSVTSSSAAAPPAQESRSPSLSKTNAYRFATRRTESAQFPPPVMDRPGTGPRLQTHESVQQDADRYSTGQWVVPRHETSARSGKTYVRHTP